MEEETVLTLSQVRALCQQYDAIAGHFPENPWEGWAVLSFIEATLRGEEWRYPPTAPADWDISEEG